MRYLKVLLILALSATLLVIVAAATRQTTQQGKIPLRSGVFQSCATELAPSPKSWAVGNVNLEHSVRLIILADVCRNSLLGTSTTSAFHIVASPERTASPSDMTASELQQLMDDNTLLDLNTSTLGEIHPVVVMLHELPKGVVQYDIRDEATTRRDLGIELICTQPCDPGKIRIRRRSALGANFYYVFFNPQPLEL
jgi:hypothetical protein